MSGVTAGATESWALTLQKGWWLYSVYTGFVLLNSEYIRVVSITIDLPVALHEFSAQPRRLLVLHRLSLSMMLPGHRLGEGHRRP